MVVAIAAGLASEGAAMAPKAAEANGALELAATVVAQPPNKVLEAKVPKGSMGAVARNLSAERRVVKGVCDMEGFRSRVDKQNAS